ncbi:hypothetical protein J5N97_016602 [Dioscorea zingiberensis]|uniref:FRIGIDA-like protein n=1 Tax=Dioscorea zingiberensis TaxID=325984 RepID=A0A9D5CLF4_9LILI|nr:hypothetical protein J5N97_016602 [Dioscorea zingiberensis]
MAARKPSEASSPLSSTSEGEEDDEQGVVEGEHAMEGRSGASIAGSMEHLRTVSEAMSQFFRKYDDLERSLGAIRNAIDKRIENLNALRPQIRVAIQAPDPQKEDKPAAAVEEDRRSELEIICDGMGSKALRRYVASRLSDVDRLREEVPAALRRAPDVPKLVLGCMGRFYLQGSKAYSRESEMVSSRRSCVLILEFYLLSCCAAIKDDVFEEAKVGALAWKARIVSEGGISSASEMDTLGLSLFLASFGFPMEFGTRDFYALLQRCNLKLKADLLRRSTILIDKMPEILEDMLSNKMDVEAVDLACYFGFVKEFPPLPLLSSLLDRTLQAAKEERRGQCSLKLLKELNEKELAVLKAIVKCLEDHKLDQSKLSRFDIYKKIAQLEKDISNVDRKLKERSFKRKAEVAGSLNKIETQAKFPRPASTNVSRGLPLHINQGSAVPSESRGRYNDLLTGNTPYQLHIEPFGVNSHGPAAAVAAGHSGGSTVGTLRNTNEHPYVYADAPYTANLVNQGFGGLSHTTGNDFPRPYVDNNLPGPSPTAAQSLYHHPAYSYGYGTNGPSSNTYHTASEQQSYYDLPMTNTAQLTGANSSYPTSYLS